MAVNSTDPSSKSNSQTSPSAHALALAPALHPLVAAEPALSPALALVPVPPDTVVPGGPLAVLTTPTVDPMGEGSLRGTEVRTDLYHARGRVRLSGELERCRRGGGRRVMRGEDMEEEGRERGHQAILCVRVVRVRVRLRRGLDRGRTLRIRGTAGVGVGLCRTVVEGEVLAGMIFVIRGRGPLPLSRMRRGWFVAQCFLCSDTFFFVHSCTTRCLSKRRYMDLRGPIAPLQKSQKYPRVIQRHEKGSNRCALSHHQQGRA